MLGSGLKMHIMLCNTPPHVRPLLARGGESNQRALRYFTNANARTRTRDLVANLGFDPVLGTICQKLKLLGSGLTMHIMLCNSLYHFNLLLVTLHHSILNKQEIEKKSSNLTKKETP